ncbi:MAG: hypothetical protein V2A73_09900 [Pseudomonadota bacterium]
MNEATGIRTICENCRGNLAWDATRGQLRCESCGTLQAVPASPVHPQGGDIVEYDLASALARSRPRGRLGAGARQVKCNECGATVEFPDNVAATKCSFCDSPSVLSQEARADLLAPESLIPFAVDRDHAVASFKSWLGKLWFRPSDLKEKAGVAELRGVYIPYWTFDCSVTSRWTADAGYYYYVDERYTATENGKTVERARRVRHTRWEPASGQRRDSYDDHLVPASRGLPPKLSEGIKAFDTGGLVAYAPQYLQGFAAESYAIDLGEAWGSAQSEISSEQVAKCAGDVPGDTHRDLRANHSFAEATFKHILLPVWLAAFRYNSKVYRFLVNGQTGVVSGEAPLSVLKVLLFVALLVAIAVGIVLLSRFR